MRHPIRIAVHAPLVCARCTAKEKAVWSGDSRYRSPQPRGIRGVLLGAPAFGVRWREGQGATPLSEGSEWILRKTAALETSFAEMRVEPERLKEQLKEF